MSNKSYKTIKLPSTAFRDGSETLDLNVEDAISRLPSTRYYGSKRRLLPWIYKKLKDVSFNTVLDGFGGTASVSLLFKAMGKTVTYHDALQCNTVSARALLSSVNPFCDNESVKSIFDSVAPCRSIISENFSGIFYTDDENEYLDGLVKIIRRQRKPGVQQALYYSIFQACLQKRPFNSFHRANLNLRLNENVDRSFGNKTTWDTPFETLAYRAYLGLAKTVWESGAPHEVLSPVDVSELRPTYDLVYLDPPYINGHSCKITYLQRYHFLEGMLNYEKWPRMIQVDMKNKCLRPWTHISEWERKSTFKQRLFDLVYRHRKSIVVLSYVTGGYPSAREIERYFRDVFSMSRVHRMKISHALTRNQKTELLFIGYP